MTPQRRQHRVVVAALAVCLSGTTLAARNEHGAVNTGGAVAMSLHPTSSSFTDGSAIPQRLTCDGDNLSPSLHWTPPAGTKSVVIVMDDPDAPSGLFTHWLAYDIPADVHDLAEGASTPTKRLARGAEGINDFGNIGYGGPCPPPGAPHHYNVQVYALDTSLDLPSGQSRGRLTAAMHGHVLAEGRISGLYARR